MSSIAAISTMYRIHGVEVTTEAETTELHAALIDLLRPFELDARTVCETTTANLALRITTTAFPGILPAGNGVWLEYGPLLGTVDEHSCYLAYNGRYVARYLMDQALLEAGIPPDIAVDTWAIGHAILFPLLVVALRERGLFPLHAAALECNGQAVLLPAASGSGKTTLTISLIRGGFRLLSDDSPLLRLEDPLVVAYSFPERLNITAATSAFFPELGAYWRADACDDRGKAPVDCAALYGDCIARFAVPRVIVFPVIGGGSETVIEPLAKAAALLHLVALAMPCASRHRSAEQFALFAALVQQARCYTMRTGTDLDKPPDLLKYLLDVEFEEHENGHHHA